MADVSIRGGRLGYQGHDVDKEYLVVIENQRPWLQGEQTGVKSKSPTAPPLFIYALLQEKIDMTTKSDWRPLTASSIVTKIFDETMQMVLKRAPVNKWMTRRIWDGTSPLEFTLNLKFEAESDVSPEEFRICRPA